MSCIAMYISVLQCKADHDANPIDRDPDGTWQCTVSIHPEDSRHIWLNTLTADLVDTSCVCRSFFEVPLFVTMHCNQWNDSETTEEENKPRWQQIIFESTSALNQRHYSSYAQQRPIDAGRSCVLKRVNCKLGKFWDLRWASFISKIFAQIL